MNTNFEPASSSMLDDSFSNAGGKEKRKAKRAARKEKHATKKAARKAKKGGGAMPTAPKEETPESATAPEAKEETPKEATPAETSKSGDTPTGDDDKIFGMNKYVVYGGGALLTAAAIFLGYKLMKGKGTPAATA